MESQEHLQLERLENKRVNKYLDDIVQEVEAKAPILKRQRDEHERMQKSVAGLSVQLEQAVKVGSRNEFLWKSNSPSHLICIIHLISQNHLIN